MSIYLSPNLATKMVHLMRFRKRMKIFYHVTRESKLRKIKLKTSVWLSKLALKPSFKNFQIYLLS
jgi:hypothetical protein